MTTCDKCDDLTEYVLYQDQFERWKIGTQLDINIYREHVCKQKPRQTKYWCFKCGDNGAPIPIDNPCIHRRPVFEAPPKKGLQKFS